MERTIVCQVIWHCLFGIVADVSLHSPTVFAAGSIDPFRPKQFAEVVPGIVEIQNGGSSSPGGVARTLFYQERGDRHEERVQQTEAS